MRRFTTLLAIVLSTSSAGESDELYKLGKASMRHEDVPRGKVTEAAA